MSEAKPTNLQEATNKPTNPKDAIGSKKVSPSTVPAHVLMSASLAMLEGAIKYARHNYRVAGVRSSVYYDASLRHLFAWWEGEDIDPDSGLSHIDKAIASLIVLKDAMVMDKLTDDRPPKMASGWIQELNKKAEALIEKLPPSKEPFTELNYKDSELYKEQPLKFINIPPVSEYYNGQYKDNIEVYLVNTPKGKQTISDDWQEKCKEGCRG